MAIIEKPTIKQRVTSLIAAGAVASAMAMPAMAMAVEPSADAQTGTGSTDVTVQSKIGDLEVGGNTDANNPDGDDADDWGDNIAFSVPSAINFVADAQGVLTGPSAAAAYVENHSAFAIHATSFDVDPEGAWSIVDDGTAPTAANAADFQFGPAAGKIDAYDYLEKAAIEDVNPTYVEAWNMGAAVDDYAVTSDASAAVGKTYYVADGADFVEADVSGGFASGVTYYEKQVADRVEMDTAGNIFNVSEDITDQSKIATIKTYVRQGTASVS